MTSFISEDLCKISFLNNEEPETETKFITPMMRPQRNRLKKTKSHKSADEFNVNNPASQTPEVCGYRSGNEFKDAVIIPPAKDDSVQCPASPELIPWNAGPHHQDSAATQRISRELTPKEPRCGGIKEFSGHIYPELLKEIQSHNKQFPVQRIFTLLKKKKVSAEEGSYDLEAQRIDDCNHYSASCVQKKRKQELEGNTYDGVYKRHSTNKGLSSIKKLDSGLIQSSKSKTRLSLTKRKQQQTPFCAVVTDPVQNDSVQQKQCHIRLETDDVLWTDSYSPQAVSEVIGNSTSVQQLHSWLNEWKTRSDNEDRRKRQEHRRKKVNSDDLWDCGDFEGDAAFIDQENDLCNTVLITGPSGVGKTAAVYACANELGFKVFEVNSSVLRCGRILISQLTEATQSHQVHLQRDKTHKSENIDDRQIKLSSLYKDAHKKVASSLKELHVSPGASHPGRKPQPVKLTQFFRLKSKQPLSNSSDPEHLIHDKRQEEVERSSKYFEQNTAVPMSLLLFEEVDIIFPEDVGFLTAIKTFMSTTKRPIILTTNDPLFGTRLRGTFDEIHFQTPSLQTARSYLQCLCVVENTRTDPDDIAFLLCQNKGDLRQSLLQLQFWICSGGGSTELQTLKDKLRCPSWRLLENRCLEILSEKAGGSLLYSSLLSTDFSFQRLGLYEAFTPNSKDLRRLRLRTSSNAHEPTSSNSFIHRGLLSSCDPKSCPHLKLKPFSVDEHCKASLLSMEDDKLESETNAHEHDEPLMLDFQHLLCLATFFNNMSFLDASLHNPSLIRTGLCKPEPFCWMGATLKDGILDLPNEEDFEHFFEISSQIVALVEGMAYLQCRTELCGIWREAVRLREKSSSERWEQTISSFSQSSGGKSFRLCSCQFCAPRSIYKRREITSVLVFSKRSGCHGNKRAISMDYLPFLRSICRSERGKQHSVRHPHYLSSLNLPRNIVDLLALDFP
ncbi:hypothetical protein DNTS_034964 [Danionella cerebrum]|uniref:AAA+ ATPase domain-containing protein n=1 Tax=Danionella cerebrum TaxID=2873325 RepID=A0A553MT52_9TELE|nr:hypothetical protein DNTS_034964 [Danionella translucida]